MKKFRFSLENVMKFREHQAEHERSELERLHGIRAELRQDRLEIEAELAAIWSNIAGTTTVPAAELSQMAFYVRSLDIKRGQACSEEAACDTRIDAQRHKCLEADRNHRLLAKCKEKRLSTWQREADREQDETALSAFLNNWNRQMYS